MLHSWSYYPSTLSCSLCLRLERTNTLLVLLVFSTNRAHALDLFLVSMSRYTSSKIWKTFTTPRLHQVKNLDLQAQTHWRDWTLKQSLPWDAWGRNYWSNPVVEVITNLLPVKRDNPGRPVIPISIGMVDFLEALCDFGSSVNIMPKVLYEKILYTSFTRNNRVLVACRSDTKFPKGNIEEPLRPSWYLVHPSKLRGDRDWYWWEGTRLREAIPKHLESCHLC